MGTWLFSYEGWLETTLTVPLVLKLNSLEDPTLNLWNLATLARFLRSSQHVISQTMWTNFFLAFFYHYHFIILSLSFYHYHSLSCTSLRDCAGRGGAFRFFFKKLLWYFHWNMPLSEPLYLLDLALYNTINPLYWEESVSGFLSIRPRQQVLSMGRLVNKMSKFSL